MELPNDLANVDFEAFPELLLLWDAGLGAAVGIPEEVGAFYLEDGVTLRPSR